jgi:DNA modification methylase
MVMPTLNFKGKTAIESYHLVVPHHALDFDAKRSLTKSPDLDGNLIIEGDNLLALKSLLPTHGGKVKCIYIDPPYNTGNEGWVYNDNLTQPQFKEWIGRVVGKEGEDATRHDKWCCMMYPRLQLLKELLRDDGAIFISIDDNEVHHLRMMMDEIFGEQNFVANAIWQKRTSPDMRLAFSTAHDYVLVYSRNIERLQLSRLSKTPQQMAQFKNPDNDPRGPWVSSDYTAQGFRPNQMYKIRTPGGAEYVPPPGVCWKNVESVFLELVHDGRIWFGKNGKAMPRRKTFLSELEGNAVWTWWANDEVGHTQEAKKELDSILGVDHPFDTPKPTRLLARILAITTEQDSLILDSFAGSGTTAHAVLELNKEDGGNRRFILVQMPYESKEQEKDKFNICEKITAERVRRVIKGYTYTTQKGKQVKVEGLGGEFTYARVGKMLFDQFRNFPDGAYPSYEELARYIFYTETSRSYDPKGMNPQTGKIGEHGKWSYYLLYTPNGDADSALTKEWLEEVSKQDTNAKVVYCEKIWVRRDELAALGNVRAMVIPFNLK